MTFISMPIYDGPEPPAHYDFRYAEGRVMWVQEPSQVTESSGSNGPTPPPVFWGAELGCDPFYTDWTTYGTIDVLDAALVPAAVVDVQAIDSSCDPVRPESYPTALQVVLSTSGDLVDDCGVTPCTSPQGVVDFVDIAAVVDKFRNLPNAIRKARSDIVNSDVAQPIPDRIVDFVDISCVVDAFRNDPCAPPGPPVDDPCQ